MSVVGFESSAFAKTRRRGRVTGRTTHRSAVRHQQRDPDNRPMTCSTIRRSTPTIATFWTGKLVVRKFVDCLLCCQVVVITSEDWIGGGIRQLGICWGHLGNPSFDECACPTRTYRIANSARRNRAHEALPTPPCVEQGSAAPVAPTLLIHEHSSANPHHYWQRAGTVKAPIERSFNRGRSLPGACDDPPACGWTRVLGQRTLTDTERFVETVAPLATDEAIIEAVAETVTNALTTNVNLEAEVKGFLPPSPLRSRDRSLRLSPPSLSR